MARRPIALTAVLSLGAVLLIPTASVTGASWADVEWTYSTVGAIDCDAPDGGFTTRGAGRVLSGSMLGVDLDQIVEASGVAVTNDGNITQVQPVGTHAADPGPDAFADPLDVAALNAVNIHLGGGLLKLPLGTDAGVLSQYGRASSSGVATGASGYITNSGGIGLDSEAGYPELASLDLSGLLAVINPNVADAIGGVADVSLEIGALAGRARIDGCDLTWGAEPTDAIVRDYLASSIDMLVTSGTVTLLANAASGVVDTLSTTVSGLATNTTFRSGLISAVANLLDPLLGLLGLGGITVDSFSAVIDTTELRKLMDQPFGDASGIAMIDPAGGTVRIDTAALLAKAYPGEYSDGLNGLAPNTELLINKDVINGLADALAESLGGWIEHINDALTTAVDDIVAHTAITVSLTSDQGLLGGLLDLGTITATIGESTEPTLAALRAGEVPATVTTDLDLGVLGSLLNGPVSGLVNSLTDNLGTTIAGAVDNTLAELTAVPADVAILSPPIVDVVGGLYGTLFGDGVVSLIANAQNHPIGGRAGPEDWQSLTTGQYDVAALRIGVLGELPDHDVHLYLGRGSVGPVCTLAGRCIDY